MFHCHLLIRKNILARKRQYMDKKEFYILSSILPFFMLYFCSNDFFWQWCKYYKLLTCRKVKCLQLGICVVMSTRAALQKNVENMFLMMWTGNMVGYLALLKKGRQHIPCLIALLSICGPSGGGTGGGVNQVINSLPFSIIILWFFIMNTNDIYKD